MIPFILVGVGDSKPRNRVIKLATHRNATELEYPLSVTSVITNQVKVAKYSMTPCMSIYSYLFQNETFSRSSKISGNPPNHDVELLVGIPSVLVK
jgi:hypothetical protein